MICKSSGARRRCIIAASALLGLYGEISRPAASELTIPDVIYPRLPERAASAAGFAPAGWTMESQTFGDLNRDGIPDVAVVLRQQDPRNVVANDAGLGANPLDTNPRVLAIAFRSGSSGDYILRLQNHTLIPRRVDPVLDDPLEETGGIAIERGTLLVSLHSFASAGGWTMSSVTYRFQFREERFALIGYDRHSVTRNSGETADVSINYLTGKMKVERGDIRHDKKKVVWKKLPIPSLPMSIDAIGDGLEFHPEN
jgi:hypothetical protein